MRTRPPPMKGWALWTADKPVSGSGFLRVRSRRGLCAVSASPGGVAASSAAQVRSLAGRCAGLRGAAPHPGKEAVPPAPPGFLSYYGAVVSVVPLPRLMVVRTFENTSKKLSR